MTEGLRAFINKYRVETDKKTGMLVFYKTIRHNFTPWYTESHNDTVRRKQPYLPGTEVVCNNVNTFRYKVCGTGLHVGTLDCANSFSTGYLPIVRVLVAKEDVVCVPTASLSLGWLPGHEKVRVKKLYVDKLVKFGRCILKVHQKNRHKVKRSELKRIDERNEALREQRRNRKNRK